MLVLKLSLAVFCSAISNLAKTSALMDNKGSRGTMGVRQNDDVAKAQGKCGQDAFTCPTGETVLRDPLLSCSFARCAGQTSLVEASNTNPTYQWTGVSIADDQSFCSRMTGILSDSNDKRVDSCVSVTAPDTCSDHFVHLSSSGNVGDIAHCEDGPSGCEQGAIHNCTWSFYMEDLIHKHSSLSDNCASKLLEAKRSLDGLLHSVQDVYNQLMQWNAIVQAENRTIRGYLEDQQVDWDEYVSEQALCESTSHPDLVAIQNEMEELRVIADPDVRSAVNMVHATGYQSDAALYQASSFAEVDMDEAACQTFTSLVERVQKKHGVALVKTSPDCHGERRDLQAAFNTAFATLAALYNTEINLDGDNRTNCLSEATYKYKAGVEGLNGIDDKIQDAAGKIHEAQGEIARLEPMLHDVERAVDRMRTYVETIKSECVEDKVIGEQYDKIKALISDMAECPGRNNFTITVPHWTPETPTTGPTPVPTPWYDDPKADGVRDKL